jgi:hypothetical protein
MEIVVDLNACRSAQILAWLTTPPKACVAVVEVFKITNEVEIMLIVYEVKSAGDELQKIICFLIENHT